jgi:hypothetical protein
MVVTQRRRAADRQLQQLARLQKNAGQPSKKSPTSRSGFSSTPKCTTIIRGITFVFSPPAVVVNAQGAGRGQKKGLDPKRVETLAKQSPEMAEIVKNYKFIAPHIEVQGPPDDPARRAHLRADLFEERPQRSSTPLSGCRRSGCCSPARRRTCAP